jgi:hypothetical protein
MDASMDAMEVSNAAMEASRAAVASVMAAMDVSMGQVCSLSGDRVDHSARH